MLWKCKRSRRIWSRIEECLKEIWENSYYSYEVQLELNNIAIEFIETKIKGDEFDSNNQLAYVALCTQQRLSSYCHSWFTIKIIIN